VKLYSKDLAQVLAEKLSCPYFGMLKFGMVNFGTKFAAHPAELRATPATSANQLSYVKK
jgi:hypothetical protein